MNESFGGSVPNSTNVEVSDKKSKKGHHHKPKRVVDEAKIAKQVGLVVNVKHAFGSSPLHRDGIKTYSSLTGDKESSDRVVFRVGKQVCIYDAEGNQQQFLNDRPTAVVNILHFAISPNNRYISVCETLRTDKDDEGHAQVSIYSLTTFQRLKTCTHPSTGEFICSTFCGDSKYIATLTSEPDNQIITFLWEKEKMHKYTTLPCATYKICASPTVNNHMMITCSGPSFMKSFHVAADGNLKPTNLLISSKETDATFIDHTWLDYTHGGGAHKMVALVDISGLSGGGGQGVNNSSVSSAAGDVNRKQSIHVFEGVEATAQQCAVGNLPILLDHRQTITIRVDYNEISNKHGLRLNGLAPSSKGFIIIGSKGFVSFYERTEDIREPYQEFKMLLVGDAEDMIGSAVTPNEEKMVAVCKNSRVLTVNLIANNGAEVENAVATTSAAMTNTEQSPSAGGRSAAVPEGGIYSGGTSTSNSSQPQVTDFTSGGFHLTSIGASAMASERSILMTIGGAGSKYANAHLNGSTTSAMLAASSGASANGVVDNRILRLWNYENHRCELAYYFGNNEPLAVAVHHTGFQVLVSFKDRVRLYTVLLDRLKLYKEAIQKMCRELKFCNGGQYWAASSGINVVIYDTSTFNQLTIFQGHMFSVRCLAWELGDQMIVSAGMDGNVYGWRCAADSTAKLEILTASPKSDRNIISMAVDSTSPLFPAPAEYDDSGVGGPGGVLKNDSPINRVVTTNMDGSMSIMQYRHASSHPTAGSAQHKGAEVQVIGDPEVIRPLPSDSMGHHGVGAAASEKFIVFTSLCMSADNKKLYAGTSVGSIRIYPWPLPRKNPADVGKDGVTVDNSVFLEFQAHASGIIDLYESPSRNTLVSTGEDGCIFIHTLTRIDAGDSSNSLTDDMGADEAGYNNAIIMTSAEDVEEQVQQVVELQKRLQEAHIKFSFELHQLQTTNAEDLRSINESHDYALKLEKERYDDIFGNFTKRVKELQGTINSLEAEQIKVTRELENRYEHKLADQLDRYDKVCEEMEALRQKCEGVLMSEREDFTKQLNDSKYEAAAKDKQSTQVIKRLVDDKSSEKVAFKEILEQQEYEYEDELRQLITSAESELSTERENINKLRTLLQSKNTKLEQMKKKLLEISLASKAMKALLESERKEKRRLNDTIEYLKENMKERDETIRDNKKVILELRTTTRTLENFRIVLDHRLQQLSAERGPITSHIENLEQHIATMYEELVEEFDSKKASTVESDQKDQKITMISQEIVKLRGDIKQKEAFIAAFRRELGIVIGSSLKGKDMEDSVKMLYKKYVLNETTGKVVKSSALAIKKTKELLTTTPDDYDSDDEKDGPGAGPPATAGGGGGGGRGPSISNRALIKEVEEELIEAAKESERQKLFVERQSSDYVHRLNRTRTEALRLTKTRLNENSTLMYECNDLRREVRELQRKLELSLMRADKSERELKALMKGGTTGKGQSFEGSLAGMGFDEGAEAGSTNGGAVDAGRSLTMNNIYDLYDGEAPPATDDAHVMPPIAVSKTASGRNTPKGSKKQSVSSSALPVFNGDQGRMLSKSASAGLANLDGGGSNDEGLQGMGVSSPSRQKVVSQFNNNKKYLTGGNGKSIADRTAERLSAEIDSLANQLDNSEREKILQARELNRLKNIIRKSSMGGNGTDSQVLEGGSVMLGQRDAVRDGNQIVNTDTVVVSAVS